MPQQQDYINFVIGHMEKIRLVCDSGKNIKDATKDDCVSLMQKCYEICREDCVWNGEHNGNANDIKESIQYMIVNRYHLERAMIWPPGGMSTIEARYVICSSQPDIKSCVVEKRIGGKTQQNATKRNSDYRTVQKSIIGMWKSHDQMGNKIVGFVCKPGWQIDYNDDDKRFMERIRSCVTLKKDEHGEFKLVAVENKVARS